MLSDQRQAPRRCLRVLWWALALLAIGASAQPVPEHDLKAAFVFNFAVFTEWPSEVLAAGAPMTVCASAANPLMGALGQLNDKLVNGHRIALRSAAAGVRGCHVLVLDRSDRERWAQLKRELAGSHVLTVSDDADISADGAVIGLSVEDKRVGFAVHLGAARSARLNLSSKLLRLARSVQ
ncbi:MAG: YfiR family protein [Pseudomonadota bacterium]